MQDEPLITFGQLLKIKREQMQLNLGQAAEQTKVTNLSAIERDKTKPMKKTLAKLIKFYKITDSEMKALKSIDETRQTKKPSSNNIFNAIEIIRTALQRVSQMEEKGLLASSIKKEALNNLEEARQLLVNIQIVDLLI